MKSRKINIDIFSSQFFLVFCCVVIFFISIFLRSTNDIGADTGVYLNLGKKIFVGGKYYYDFFESNFPLSFYFYALQYQASQILHLNPIILCEIIINFLALSSIFFSARILKHSTICDNGAHYNLILISYFLGFFLRPYALQIGEFGTKTSLFLILFYPYLSFSFVRKNALTTKDLICRGCLMGLIPCLKPHYLVFIIFIEFYRFYQKKSLQFFLELDKLLMLLIGAFYLFLMIKFTPEFFEFIVPMWPKIYSAYNNQHVFFDNFFRHLAARIFIFSFIFLIFSRLNFSDNDKILTLVFFAASLLLILENIGTVDQIVIFFAVATICFLKFSFDLISSKKISFSDNKFIILTLIFLPIFDLKILPAAIFGLGGFVNIWWLLFLIYPFFFLKKFHLKYFSLFFLVFFLLLFFAVLTLKYMGGWCYIAINLFFLFVILFFFERKIHSKISTNFSSFSVFVIVATISCLIYVYISSIAELITKKNQYSSPNKLTDAITYYSKIYAPKNADEILVNSAWIARRFPLLNYLEKEDHSKFHIVAIQADKAVVGSILMFPIINHDQIFTFSYLFDDLKNYLADSKFKILLIDNSQQILHKENRCLIGNLEYYFLNPQFKNLFLKNFRFENRLLITKKTKPTKNLGFLVGEKVDIFDQIKPSSEKILHDFEVYVRSN